MGSLVANMPALARSVPPGGGGLAALEPELDLAFEAARLGGELHAWRRFDSRRQALWQAITGDKAARGALQPGLDIAARSWNHAFGMVEVGEVRRQHQAGEARRRRRDAENAARQLVVGVAEKPWQRLAVGSKLSQSVVAPRASIGP